MTLTPPPDLGRIIHELQDRLTELEQRREGAFIGSGSAVTATEGAADLLFAKQMYGVINDPGGGVPVDPWGDSSGGFGGLFDPGSTSPQNNDCGYMSFVWRKDWGIGHNTGVYIQWLVDAEGSFGSGDWGWVEESCWHQADPDDTNGYGLSSVNLEMFCFDPERGAGAYADIDLQCYASDFEFLCGASAETLLDADLWAQGFAETRMYCLAGRDFTGGGDGVVSDENTGVQLKIRYIRDDVGAAHQGSCFTISEHAYEPDPDYGGSFIKPRDDSGVDWWHGGVRGPILTDRSTADRYRVLVASDVIGTEAV